MSPSAREKLRLQEELARRLVVSPLDVDAVHLVAGADTAYWREADLERGACCVVVVDMATHEVVEQRSAVGEVCEGYVPGLLAFRELPLFERAFAQLTCVPDVVAFDGNGYLHPRHMGIAAHASLVIDRPTFGVAKTFYNYGREGFVMPENRVGAFTDIVVAGEVCGRALRTRGGAKPVFVSVGGFIDLDAATELTMRLRSKNSRVPLPTRLADLETKRLRRELCGA